MKLLVQNSFCQNLSELKAVENLPISGLMDPKHNQSM